MMLTTKPMTNDEAMTKHAARKESVVEALSAVASPVLSGIRHSSYDSIRHRLRHPSSRGGTKTDFGRRRDSTLARVGRTLGRGCFVACDRRCVARRARHGRHRPAFSKYG